MEFAGLTLRSQAVKLAACGTLVVCSTIAAFALTGRQPADGSTLGEGPRVLAPNDVRIRVQVLNATGSRGLAMHATRYLRDRGFDVVEVGNHPENRQSTLVLDRTGHPEWAELVAKAFSATFEAKPDSSRYVDVTVLLGSDWAPPPGPFNP